MHLKRIAMPRSWALERKAEPFVARARGPQPVKLSLPLLVVLRDLLHQVSTAKEAKQVLQASKVLVNNKVIKDLKFGVGLFDRLAIKEIGSFSIYLEGQRLKVKPLAPKLLSTKPCKVLGKSWLKRHKLQLNLWGGLNLLVEPAKAQEVAIDDSILLDLEKKSILKVLKPVKGSWGLVIKGRYKGKWAELISSNQAIEVMVDNKPVKLSKASLYLAEAAEAKAQK